MKNISHTSSARDPLLQISTDGGIVNIRVGVRDSQGRRVTPIEVLADDASLEDTFWHLDGYENTRLVHIDPATALDVRPRSWCSRTTEIVYTGDGWQHNAADWFWKGDEHEANPDDDAKGSGESVRPRVPQRGQR